MTALHTDYYMCYKIEESACKIVNNERATYSRVPQRTFPQILLRSGEVFPWKRAVGQKRAVEISPPTPEISFSRFLCKDSSSVCQSFTSVQGIYQRDSLPIVYSSSQGVVLLLLLQSISESDSFLLDYSRLFQEVTPTKKTKPWRMLKALFLKMSI